MSQGEGQGLKPIQSKPTAPQSRLAGDWLIVAARNWTALSRPISVARDRIARSWPILVSRAWTARSWPSWKSWRSWKNLVGATSDWQSQQTVAQPKKLTSSDGQTRQSFQAAVKPRPKLTFRLWLAWALFVPLIILGLWLIWLRQTQERLYQAEIDLVPTTASLVEGWQAQSGEALNLSRGELLRAATTAYRQQNYPVAVIYLTTLHQTEPVYRDTLLAEAQSYVGLYNRLVELDSKLSGLNPSRRAKLEAAAAESETAGLVAQFGQPTYLLEQALAALELGLRLDPLDRRLLDLKDAIINL